MSTFGKKIRQFENLQEQNVKTFNEMFPDAKLKGFSLKCEVEIGEILGPETRRILIVDGVEISHEFTREEGSIFEEIETAPKTYQAKLAGLNTNRNTDNLFLSEKDIALGPIKYFLLQYLRGSENPYHNVNEIVERLQISKQTVNKHLDELKSAGIISVVTEAKTRNRITVNEEKLA